MIEVAIEEAQIRLDELIVRAFQGEDIFIMQDGHRVVQLVPVSQAEYQALLESAEKPLTYSDEPMTNEEIDEELYGPIYHKDTK